MDKKEHLGWVLVVLVGFSAFYNEVQRDTASDLELSEILNGIEKVLSNIVEAIE